LEVKINREIRNYTESMFFGLSLRQLVFSALAVAVAVGLYFLLKPYVGTETVSWMCIVGAAPFAALGFFTYHGMTAEQFIWAWLRSEVLEPRELRFESSTLYYDLLKSSMWRCLARKRQYARGESCSSANGRSGRRRSAGRTPPPLNRPPPPNRPRVWPRRASPHSGTAGQPRRDGSRVSVPTRPGMGNAPSRAPPPPKTEGSHASEPTRPRSASLFHDMSAGWNGPRPVLTLSAPPIL